MYLCEAASDLHVLSSFHSLNALPMYIHYTSDSLSVARLSLAYWQNMSDMCYQVESDIICSQNGQLSKQWTIAKHCVSRDFSGNSLVAHLHAGSLATKYTLGRDNPIFAKYANITYYNINISWQIGANNLTYNSQWYVHCHLAKLAIFTMGCTFVLLQHF